MWIINLIIGFFIVFSIVMVCMIIATVERLFEILNKIMKIAGKMQRDFHDLSKQWVGG